MAGDNQLPHSSAKHVSVRSAPARRSLIAGDVLKRCESATRGKRFALRR